MANVLISSPPPPCWHSWTLQLSISCLPVTYILFVWQQYFFQHKWSSFRRVSFLWKDFSSWNNFRWEEISSCDRKYLPIKRNFFLWHGITSCDRCFLFCFQFVKKCSNFIKRFCVRFIDFVSSRNPRLGCQDVHENPTLAEIHMNSVQMCIFCGSNCDCSQVKTKSLPTSNKDAFDLIMHNS